MYRRGYYRQRKPVPRNITVKYAGKCASCGAPIAVGEMATYYPAGYAGKTVPVITHVGASEGNSIRCFAWQMKPDSPTYFWKREDLEALRASMQANNVDKSLNDYAGDGLDQRWEDEGKDICGL